MSTCVAPYLATDVNNDSKMFVTMAPDEGAITFSIMTLCIMTLSIMTLCIMTLSIMTLCIMTLSIMTLSIKTLSIMTLSIMTFSIIDLFMTFSIKDIQHSDTKHKH
jgi:hypothetical protein